MDNFRLWFRALPDFAKRLCVILFYVPGCLFIGAAFFFDGIKEGASQFKDVWDHINKSKGEGL